MQIYKSFFGQRLRAARKLKKLSQETLAKALDVEAPSVSRWENGHDFPDDSRLEPICKALGVGQQYFEGNDDLIRPSDAVLRVLIQEDGNSVPLLSLLPLLKRFLAEDPAVRASTLAVLYGDQTIARLIPSADKANSR